MDAANVGAEASVVAVAVAGRSRRHTAGMDSCWALERSRWCSLAAASGRRSVCRWTGIEVARKAAGRCRGSFAGRAVAALA